MQLALRPVNPGRLLPPHTRSPFQWGTTPFNLVATDIGRWSVCGGRSPIQMIPIPHRQAVGRYGSRKVEPGGWSGIGIIWMGEQPQGSLGLFTVVTRVTTVFK